MTELTFRLVERPHSEGHTLTWVEHDDGRRKRATDEECVLWRALQEARAEKKEKKK